MHTVSFELMRSKEVEPDSFLYGVLIDQEDVQGAIKTLDRVQSTIDGVKKYEVSNTQYIIPDKNEDLRSVQIFTIKSRNALVLFVEKLKLIDDIRGGIVHATIEEEEAREFELIEEMTKLAQEKGNRYAQFCKRKLGKITRFNVKDSGKKWTSFPPMYGIDKKSVLNAIMLPYEQKDKFILHKCIEVEFEMI